MVLVNLQLLFFELVAFLQFVCQFGLEKLSGLVHLLELDHLFERVMFVFFEYLLDEGYPVG